MLVQTFYIRLGALGASSGPLCSKFGMVAKSRRAQPHLSNFDLCFGFLSKRMARRNARTGVDFNSTCTENLTTHVVNNNWLPTEFASQK